MRRTSTIVGLSGFLVGMVLGCSSNTPEAASGANAAPAQKVGDPPKAVATDAKTRLAELEKTIATRERELAELRVTADSLRKEIAAAEGGNVKVYRTPEELFADMPQNAYPKFVEGEIERAATRKWCMKNLPGRTVEWPATIETVSIDGNDPFEVRLICAGTAVREGPGDGFVFGSEFKLGAEKCMAVLDDGNSSIATGQTGGLVTKSPMVLCRSCTADESRQLRDLKGKKVMLRAKVNGAGGSVGISEGRYGTAFKGNLLVVYVEVPTVDGFFPKAGKR